MSKTSRLLGVQLNTPVLVLSLAVAAPDMLPDIWNVAATFCFVELTACNVNVTGELTVALMTYIPLADGDTPTIVRIGNIATDQNNIPIYCRHIDE